MSPTVTSDSKINFSQMYVLQSLPSHQQSLAGGIFNVVIRLSNTAVLGISTAIFSSVQTTPAGIADPILKYARTFQSTIALAAVGVLISPFIRLGTQGNAPTLELQVDKKLGKSTDAMVDATKSSQQTEEKHGLRGSSDISVAK